MSAGRESLAAVRGAEREPDDPALREIGDVALPEEGEQVMLAEGIDLDVAHDDHLVAVLAVDRNSVL